MSEFHAKRRWPDGSPRTHQSRCKPCHRAADRERLARREREGRVDQVIDAMEAKGFTVERLEEDGMTTGMVLRDQGTERVLSFARAIRERGAA